MKTGIFLTIFWLGVLTAPASYAGPGDGWATGELTLADGTQLTGELSYNWQAEVIQFRQGNVIRAFSAPQVQHFLYFDNQQNTLRRFEVVDYPIRPTLNRLLFLEQVATGSLIVYRRPHHHRSLFNLGRSNPKVTGTGDLTKDVDNFEYYVLSQGQFTPLDNFGRTVWPRMRDEFGAELNRYVASRPFNGKSQTITRLLLINQYNALKTLATPDTRVVTVTDEYTIGH